MRYRHASGFTLIELLVALFVFAILAVTAYRGLDAVSDTRDHLDQMTRKWQKLERFFARLDGETAQVLLRPIRTANGSEAPAWVGVPSTTASVEDVQLAFTRHGGTSAAGMLLPPQRIGYRLRDGKVELLRWKMPDSAPYATPDVDVVLEGVKEFKLRFMTDGLVWVDHWPLKAGIPTTPKALEVEMSLDSGERLTRVFSLP